MKKPVKIYLGLAALAVLFGIAGLSSHKALAAGLTTTQLDNATYKIIGAAEIDGTIGGTTVKFIDNNPFDSNHNYKPQSSLFCDGTVYGSNGTSDALKGITLNVSFSSLVSSGGTSINAAENLDYLDSSGNCVNYQNTIAFVKQADGSYIGSLINKTGACDPSTNSNCFCSSQGCALESAPVTTDQASTSCEASAGTSLAWLMCPLFSAASSIVQSTINIFENLLSFTVAQDLGNQSSQDSVKLTWSIIKNIASVVLVIVMLVMVFSQAISIGPFDAYTIRKILPKLVAAVILMQLSWPLVAWIIDLFNDLGNGLQDLMFAPFGGGGTLNDLGALINHAGISTAEAGVFNWVGLLTVGVATLAALPTALFLAVAAIIGLFIAIITLIFRKILIILLLIFAPLALVAWILPGTQRYWKLWSDNLIKVLAMYPLVVAIIAVGRIFAFVAGPQTLGLDTFATRFLAMLFVLVGFIGPLFILPRTFKWGGGIMSAAGGAIMNAGNRINKGLEQPIKGFGERQQGKWAKQYNPEAGLGSRVLRRIQSGNVLPTKRSQRLAIAKGDKWNQERDEEAAALIGRKGEKALAEGYTTVLRDDKGRALSAARFKTDAQGRYLDKDGQVTTDESKYQRELAREGEAVATDTKQGVAAMKQMWVDLAENGRDSHERKMAVRQLIATSSWPEVQGAYTQSGKRVIDTEAWGNSVTFSPEDYPKVLRSRVDAAPHIINSADKAYSDYAKVENARRAAAGLAPISDVEARDFKSAFRINFAIDKQMSNEDFATQSDGFWAETARMANYDGPDEEIRKQAQTIRENLKKRLGAIQAIGGTAPQQLLGHLASGGALEESVNEALGDTNIRQYLAPPGRPPSGAPPQPAGNVIIEPGGAEVRIPHAPPPAGTGWSAGQELPPDIIEPPENPPQEPQQ